MINLEIWNFKAIYMEATDRIICKWIMHVMFLSMKSIFEKIGDFPWKTRCRRLLLKSNYWWTCNLTGCSIDFWFDFLELSNKIWQSVKNLTNLSRCNWHKFMNNWLEKKISSITRHLFNAFESDIDKID